MPDSLRPRESQHARPPCPSPTPGVHRDSHPSSQWCHPAISSSVVPFSSCPQSLPASESFPMSQLFDILSSKESACNAGDADLIPGSGRSPGWWSGNPLQYSCLENYMNRWAWQATTHEVIKGQTWSSDWALSYKNYFPGKHLRLGFRSGSYLDTFMSPLHHDLIACHILFCKNVLLLSAWCFVNLVKSIVKCWHY